MVAIIGILAAVGVVAYYIASAKIAAKRNFAISNYISNNDVHVDPNRNFRSKFQMM